MSEIIITKKALDALLRIVVGCMPPIGKEKRRKNEAFLVECVKKNKDFIFEEFKDGLADGTEMYDAILKFSKEVDKNAIDEDVVLRYFGNRSHIQKTLGELNESGVSNCSEFFLHTLFIHILTCIEVTEVDLATGKFSGIYQNEGIAIKLSNIRTFSEDKSKIIVGKTVFMHFPLFVSELSNSEMTSYILSEQLADDDFMRVCRFWNGKTIDHDKIRMYLSWIEETVKRYDL